MHLSTVPAFKDQRSSALTQIHDSLSTLAAGLDSRFIEAGKSLGAAYEIIERLVTSLEGVTNAMDREESDAAVQNMRSTADHLAQLPVLQILRQEDLIEIQRASDEMRVNIEQIQRILRFLHICSHNIKIAAAGTQEFSGFADYMVERLELGESLLEGCEAQISAIALRSANVMEAEKLLAAECLRIIPQVPEKLAGDAVALQAHQAALAALAAQIAEVARAIRGKVAMALGALQIGDITRQRLEHVAEGIASLTAFLDERTDKADPIVRPVEVHMIALLAAQAEDTVEDFQRECRLLITNLRGIGPDALRLVALRDGHGGPEKNSQSFFTELEHSIAAVQSVTGRLRDADERSGLLSEATSQAVEKLAHQLKTIDKVQSDVQQMAWNTGVRCTRMQHQDGRGLAVISSEIRDFANSLEAVSANIVHSFDGLASAARSIQERRARSGKDAGQALVDSFTLIQSGGERMKASMSGLDEDASAVAQILTETTDNVDSDALIDQALDDTVGKLVAFTPTTLDLPDAAIDPLREIFGKIMRSYTMAREREVHARFALPGDMIAASEMEAPPVAQSDDDLFDDALF